MTTTKKKSATKKKAARKVAQPKPEPEHVGSRSNMRFTGQVDEAELIAIGEAIPDERERERWNQAVAAGRAVREVMSPPDALGLPPRLEAARLQFGIPDGAFDVQATFSSIYVYQISEDNVFFASRASGIHAPMSSVKRSKKTAPSGILLSAGLDAMDSLVTHGIELGDVVSILELSPWTMVVDKVGYLEFEVLILKVGDINGDRSLVERIRAGEATIKYDDQQEEHRFVDQQGRMWKPVRTHQRGDY